MINQPGDVWLCAVVVVLWSAELALDQKIIRSIPTTSKLSREPAIIKCLVLL